jgi:O-antigen ligase
MIEMKLASSRDPALAGSGRAAAPAVRDRTQLWLLVFVLLHIPLGLAFRSSSLAATAHALATLALGMIFLMTDRRPARVIYVAAYITGAEVLWRAARADIFWETGKYAVGGLLLLALLKYGRGQKAARWPILYFVLLLPSILVMPSFDREEVAFSLAGPFALAVAVMLFSIVRIGLGGFKEIMVSLLAPAVALAAYVLRGITTNGNILFLNSSNSRASGDFGPNQVAMILALGGLAAIYYALLERKHLYRYLFLGLCLWLLAQSALTFSRQGIWTTALALFVTGFYWLRDSRRKVGFVFASLVLGLLVYFLVFPFLDNYTGNALGARFANVDTTGRLEIIRADLVAFQEYPLFGVGPNQSRSYHALTFRLASAHTEYSRMLSEHGIFGLLALLVLLRAVLRRVTSKGEPLSKGVQLGLTAWALLYMAGSATRLVAPSFLFGLAAATLVLEAELSSVPAPVEKRQAARVGESYR